MREPCIACAGADGAYDLSLIDERRQQAGRNLQRSEQTGVD